MKHTLSKITHAIKHYKLSLPASIVIGSIIISLGLVGYGLVTGNVSPKSASTTFAGKEIDSSDYILGKKDSKVVVIEYSDPECPFCVKLHPDLKAIQEKYGNDVAFVYRHFPLENLHPNAFNESRAIACAGLVGGEGAFYSYINALYDGKSSTQNMSTGAFTPLPQNGKELLAKTVGLDQGKFSACMNSGEAANIVKADQEDGTIAGVQGTPTTFIINKTWRGYQVVAAISGAQPAQVFAAAIEEALSR